MRRLRPVLKVVLSSLAHSLGHGSNITISQLRHLIISSSYIFTRDNLVMVLITFFIIFGVAVYFIKIIFGASYLYSHQENTH